MMPGSEGAISILMGRTYLLAPARLCLGLRRRGSPEAARPGHLPAAPGWLTADPLPRKTLWESKVLQWRDVVQRQ